jgi:anti-sigma factor RsiW
MTLCTSIDTLAMAYLDDELADEELRDFELHLIDCAACRGRVEAEREAIAELRRRLAPPPTPDLVRARVIAALDAEDAVTARAETRARWTHWLLPGAATVAAAAALLLFVTMREPEAPKQKSAAAVVAGQRIEAPQIMPVGRSPMDARALVDGVIGWGPSVGVATGELTIHRTAMWRERVGDLDMSRLVYDVGLPWGAHIGVWAFGFDSSRVDMHSGQRVRIDGLDLYVAQQEDARGASVTLVCYDAPGGRGWVFAAPQLSDRDLLDLVAYHLLDDVGAR